MFATITRDVILRRQVKSLNRKVAFFFKETKNLSFKQVKTTIRIELLKMIGDKNEEQRFSVKSSLYWLLSFFFKL